VTPPEAEAEAEAWGRARRRPSPEVEVEAKAWGRARRSSLLHSRLNSGGGGSGSPVVSFTLVVGTVVGTG
jgi:hypothetical protein